MRKHVRIGLHGGAVGAIAFAVTLVAGFLTVSVAQNQPPDRALMTARVGASVGVESNAIMGLRRFEPSNRTYWHSHEGGFIMFVQEGSARVQQRGQPMRELGPGEIDYTPPGVEHWHGAGPDEPLLQLGVVPFGGGISFLEAVTDEQYNGQAL